MRLKIFKALLDHGACPNVIRADGQHLLALCRARAKWIDDPEPSVGNQLYQVTISLGASRGRRPGAHAAAAIQEMEREESIALVELVTTCIQQHKLCRYCKAHKQKMQLANLHLQLPNYTDAMSARLGWNEGMDVPQERYSTAN
jgi:hypothetical protein